MASLRPAFQKRLLDNFLESTSPAASNINLPVEIYRRLCKKPFAKAAHGLVLSLLDGLVIILNGILNPGMSELGLKLLALYGIF